MMMGITEARYGYSPFTNNRLAPVKVRNINSTLINILSWYLLNIINYISYLLSRLYSAVLVSPSSLAALEILPLCFSIT